MPEFLPRIKTSDEHGSGSNFSCKKSSYFVLSLATTSGPKAGEHVTRY
jgi:hypothetical protein